MDVSWRDLSVLLRSKANVEATTEAIVEVVAENVGTLPEIFHELCFNTLISKVGFERNNAAYLLYRLCSTYRRILCPLLLESDNDGALFSITEFDIEKIIEKTERKSDQTLETKPNAVSGSVYSVNWLAMQRKELIKRLGLHDDTLENTGVDSEIVALINDSDLTKFSVVDVPVLQKALDLFGGSDDDSKSFQRTAETWFARLVRCMVIGLLDSVWEVRHGYSLGLHAVVSGMFSVSLNPNVLEPIKSSLVSLPGFIGNDIVNCGICVLLLDRFMDFGCENLQFAPNNSIGSHSNNVYNAQVAQHSLSPVKEVASSLLAKVLKNTSESQKLQVWNVLRRMILNPAVHWSVVLGGVMSIRYVIDETPRLLIGKGNEMCQIIARALDKDMPEEVVSCACQLVSCVCCCLFRADVELPGCPGTRSDTVWPVAAQWALVEVGAERVLELLREAPTCAQLACGEQLIFKPSDEAELAPCALISVSRCLLQMSKLLLHIVSSAESLSRDISQFGTKVQLLLCGLRWLVIKIVRCSLGIQVEVFQEVATNFATLEKILVILRRYDSYIAKSVGGEEMIASMSSELYSLFGTVIACISMTSRYPLSDLRLADSKESLSSGNRDEHHSYSSGSAKRKAKAYAKSQTIYDNEQPAATNGSSSGDSFETSVCENSVKEYSVLTRTISTLSVSIFELLWSAFNLTLAIDDSPPSSLCCSLFRCHMRHMLQQILELSINIKSLIPAYLSFCAPFEALLSQSRAHIPSTNAQVIISRTRDSQNYALTSFLLTASAFHRAEEKAHLCNSHAEVVSVAADPDTGSQARAHRFLCVWQLSHPMQFSNVAIFVSEIANKLDSLLVAPEEKESDSILLSSYLKNLVKELEKSSLAEEQALQMERRLDDAKNGRHAEVPRNILGGKKRFRFIVVPDIAEVPQLPPPTRHKPLASGGEAELQSSNIDNVRYLEYFRMAFQGIASILLHLDTIKRSSQCPAQSKAHCLQLSLVCPVFFEVFSLVPAKYFGTYIHKGILFDSFLRSFFQSGNFPGFAAAASRLPVHQNSFEHNSGEYLSVSYACSLIILRMENCIFRDAFCNLLFRNRFVLTYLCSCFMNMVLLTFYCELQTRFFLLRCNCLLFSRGISLKQYSFDAALLVLKLCFFTVNVRNVAVHFGTCSRLKRKI
jgi:hypothetical protein